MSITFAKILHLIVRAMAMVLLVAGLSMSAWANIDTYQFDNPRQEAQYRALIEEFRCPKCQNQNLAGSDAPIAQDLKQKTYDMVKDGRSDAEIRQYMNERYGDFISYKPPVRPSTWILWFFPPVLLVFVMLAWFIRNRNSSKRAAVIANPIEEGYAPLSAAEQQRLQDLLNANDNAANAKTSEINQAVAKEN
ncbi:cytochrome c-type biogenesis protein CcmH [Moraxella osloensis]|uniref:Cytochrome c-type biogenesis protein n=1 Tax=Faucicola osloensis TaxID=34062 RepID=A0AAW6TE73_FAUOS|nr:cytochrome c-type biogenesis protein [Moraxella osloensis]MDI4509075.1 cytochrome c-type biogenesis protein CcmH [Moraxella osloensis]